MIDASERLVTASCPRCDLLFSVEPQPTLTDAEHDAIEDAIKTVSEALDLMDGEDSWTTATLRKMLERLHT